VTVALNPIRPQLVAIFYLDDCSGKTSPSPDARWCLEAWDLQTGRRSAVWSVNGPREALATLHFSPDGERLVTGGNNGFQVRNTQNGQVEWAVVTDPATMWLGRGPQPPPGQRTSLEWVLYPSAYYHVAFQADGQRFLCTRHEGKPAVELYETASGKVVTAARVKDLNDYASALSPGGRPVFLARGDRIFLLQSLDEEPRVGWQATPGAKIYCLALSPDGNVLVSVDSNADLRVWHLPWLRRELAALGLQLPS
jgi:WD40 repeat protein